MKKKLIALLVLFLTSCSSNTNTELKTFLKNFNKVYPDGFYLDDGYYEVTKRTTNYLNNEITIEDTYFKGNLTFTNTIVWDNNEIITNNPYDFLYFGTFTDAIYKSNTTVINDSDNNYTTKEIIKEIYYKDNSLYIFNQEKENGKIISSFTEGAKNVHNTYFQFYNYLNFDLLTIKIIPPYVKDKDYGVGPYGIQKFINVSNKYTLTYMERIEYLKKIQYFFDSNYKLIKNINTYSKNNGNNLSTYTFIAKKCNPVDIIVKENYDKQYEENSICIRF